MNFLSYVISIAIFTILAQNIVFQSVFGFNIVVYAAQKRSRMAAFSLIIFITVFFSSMLSSAVDYFIRDNSSYYIYMPLVYIVIISFVYFSALYIMWRFFPKFYSRIKNYVHIAVYNCAVLGSLMINNIGNGFTEYLAFSVGLPLGFIIAGYLLLAAAKRLNSEEVPAAFRGYPITMVYAGIISMAFYALYEYTL